MFFQQFYSELISYSDITNLTIILLESSRDDNEKACDDNDKDNDNHSRYEITRCVSRV